MWMIEDYWRECERRGFVKHTSPGKVIFDYPEDLGQGSFELWGDTSTVVTCVLDFTLNKPWHILDHSDEKYLQVSLYESGVMDICTAQYQRTVVEHGLNCFINYPGMSTFKRISAGDHCRATLVTFRESFFEQLPFQLPVDFWETASRLLTQRVIKDPAATAILRQLRDCNLEGDALAMYTQGKSYEIFALMLSYLTEHKVDAPVHLSTRDRELLDQVKEMLQQRMEDPPSIQELAACTGLNQQKLMTGFRYLHNTTIYGYLKQLRMKKAAVMLQNTDLPIIEISRSVGYHGDGHFQNAFRDVYGITPHSLRRAMKS